MPCDERALWRISLAIEETNGSGVTIAAMKDQCHRDPEPEGKRLVKSFSHAHFHGASFGELAGTVLRNARVIQGCPACCSFGPRGSFGRSGSPLQAWFLRRLPYMCSEV
jgi:hypothetical protein